MQNLLFSNVLDRHLPYPPVPNDYRPPTEFPRIGQAKRISLDFETYDPELPKKGPGVRREGYVCGIGVQADDKNGRYDGPKIYVPIRHQGGLNCDEEKAWQWLRDELNNFKGEIVGSNVGLYDGDYAQAHGVRPAHATWRDIQFAEALIDENADSYHLQDLALKYEGTGKVNTHLKQLYGDNYIRHFPEVHPAHAEIYSFGDLELPLRILDKQEKTLHSENLKKLFDLECRLVPMLLYMREKGVRVDLERAAELERDLATRYQEALGKLHAIVGFAVDPEAPTDLVRAFEQLGIKYPLTEKGNPSFRGQWLEHLNHPFAELVCEAREYEKLRGTFVEGYILNGHINGRIHCEFHPLRSADEEGERGTVSGRFSSTHPNLQNIPRRSNLGKLVRECFVPDDGSQWWSFDYCVAPDTLILTADLTWERADKLRIGQQVISCDEVADRSSAKQRHRRLRKGVVEGLKLLQQPCLRITTDQGVVVCSTEHRWLARKGYQTFSWRKAKKLRAGQIIAFLGQPWQTDNSREGGYLAGLFDGEGTLNSATCSFNQNPGIVLDTGVELLERRNFRLHVGPSTGTTTCVRINGGREERLRFLGSIRPKRLLAKAAVMWENKMLRSRCTKAARIIAIESLGLQQVVAIQTTHKTFIANGFVSHNSQIEYRYLVHYAVAAKCLGADIAQRMYREDPKTDFHKMVSSLTGLERDPAKTLNFGLAYGMGKDKLGRSLNEVWDIWDELAGAGIAGKANQKALDIMAEYHSKAPFIKELYNMASERAQRVGFVKTILGRRSRFRLWEPDTYDKGNQPFFQPYASREDAERAYGEKIRRFGTHKALNRILQGSAAEAMKVSMVNLWEGGILKSGDLTVSITVHDELNGSKQPGSQGEKLLANVREIMENAIPLQVPVLVEGGLGQTWAEAK